MVSGTACRQELETTTSLLAVHRHLPDRWPFLLSSSAPAGALGRYSLLLRTSGESLQLDSDGRLEGPGKGEGFLQRLRDWSSQQQSISLEPKNGEPFAGGWFVYLGYELAGEIEPTLELAPADDGLPVARAERCTAAIIHDHVDRRCWLVAESAEILTQAAAEVAAIEPDQLPAMPADLALQCDPERRFTDGVNRIRRYIRDGDVFQVNLSRGWEARCDQVIDPATVYDALARANPAPFAALARMPGGTVISSSPERLVEVRGDQVQTRPIAGTRPRGGSDHDDATLSEELVSHPKERAEHIMLIDLERNDLGRVCRTGSVEVDELMVVESYAHVHHIVSNVRGRLQAGVHPVDVIAAVFPGGTITGCPKVRCMEIIAELEQAGRGFYTGALGYLGLGGSLDLNILIRSMVVNDRRIGFRTGAGIVADSDPEAELRETEDKARGLLRALGHD